MSGFSIALIMCLLVLVGVEGYKKSNMGSPCSKQAYEIQTEQECISACKSMGINYLGSWDGPGDFPKCTYTEGKNRVCHFNTSPNPSRAKVFRKEPAKDYSAICLECVDTHPKGTERCLRRKAKGDCVNKKAIQEKCALTCGICAADNANIVVPPQESYELSAMGQFCNPQTLELQTERECINACNELGYQYLGSWYGPRDFPKCTVVLGGNKACHFNTSPVARTPNKDYAAVCKKP